MLVQSIGGGGGLGGLNVAASVNTGTGRPRPMAWRLPAGLGGKGGTGADAGDVSLTSNGNVFVNTDRRNRSPDTATPPLRASSSPTTRRAWSRSRSAAAAARAE